jgi:hypothetical protein
VSTIQEALGLFSGLDPGRQGADGSYPSGSLLGLAVARAREYWEMATARSRPTG